MFNTLAIALLLSTMALSILLTVVFTNLNIRQTNDISTRMLSRLAFITEQVVGEADSVLLSLGYGENIDLNTMMFGASRDRLREYSGHSRMRLLQTIYPSIAYVGVYNGVMDELMCTVGLDDVTLAGIRGAVLARYSTPGSKVQVPMAGKKIVVPGIDPALKTITIIYYSPLSKPGRIGAIFLAIDCQYLSQFISAINRQDFQQTLLVDAGGLVLSHPDESQLLTNIGTVDYIKQALESGSEDGSFFTSYQNERTLVTYHHSKSLGWTYITLTPYSDILSKISSLYGVIMAASVLLILLGALLSLFATKRTFSPIANLLAKAGYAPAAKTGSKADEIKYLEQQFTYYVNASSTNEALLMNYALESLLNGELSEETDSLLHQNKAGLAAPYYMICLLCISKSSTYRDLARKEKNLMQFTLAKVARECLAPICAGVHPVSAASNTVAVILGLRDGTMPKSMLLALMEAQKIFKESLSLTFSASISGITDDLYALQDAYEEAIQLNTERFFLGESSILLGWERKTTEADYNQRLENRIWNAVRENDDDALVQTVDLFIAELRTFSYKHARLYISQLTINLLSCSLALLPGLEMDRFDSYKRNMENQETLEQSHTELLALCRQLAALHARGEDTAGHDAVNRALALTAERYMDASFCVNTAAEAVGLSIIYFNRVFKRKTGQSYSTYLNNYRLNEACGLLRNTNQPISQVSGKVGLGNESYFYALFKKEYGITPHQYRNKHKTRPDRSPPEPG